MAGTIYQHVLVWYYSHNFLTIVKAADSLHRGRDETGRVANKDVLEIPNPNLEGHEGLITNRFCNPNLNDYFFYPPSPPVRHLSQLCRDYGENSKILFRLKFLPTVLNPSNPKGGMVCMEKKLGKVRVVEGCSIR